MNTKPESNSGRPDLCAAVGTQHMQVTERRQQASMLVRSRGWPTFTPATHASHTCLYVAVDRDTPQNRPACMLLAGTLSYSTVSNMQIWDRHPCHECKRKLMKTSESTVSPPLLSLLCQITRYLDDKPYSPRKWRGRHLQARRKPKANPTANNYHVKSTAGGYSQNKINARVLQVMLRTRHSRRILSDCHQAKRYSSQERNRDAHSSSERCGLYGKSVWVLMHTPLHGSTQHQRARAARSIA
jgi:hypothetical protein